MNGDREAIEFEVRGGHWCGIHSEQHAVEYETRTLKKIKTCSPCTYQTEGLIVWVTQIDILQLPPMLCLRFGSGFRGMAVVHGEGVRTLLAGAVVEH